MSFSSVPVRTPGRTDVSWWNALRTAGVLVENFLGTFLGETLFTIANNQVAAADVTGLLFAGGTTRSFIIDYQVYRNTTGGGATESAEHGMLIGTYKTMAATWEMTQVNVGSTGVTFSITAAGQVQYTSTNYSGTPATSTMKFKYRTMTA